MRRAGALDNGFLIRVGALMVCLVALAWVWLPGKTFPKLSSPESDRLVRLLSTACGRQNAEQLGEVKQELQSLDLPNAERQAFEEIIAIAERGQWREAHQASIKFAADQVR
jgi:hypothetical protein